MAITGPSDIFSIQAVGALVSEQTWYNTALLRTGYIGDARATAIRDEKSSTVLFPKGVTVDANSGVQANGRAGSAVTADKIDIDYDTETVYSKIVAMDVDQRAMEMLAAMVDPNAYLADEVTKRIQEHLVSRILACGVAGGTAFTDALGTASIKGIWRAITENFGEWRTAFGPPLCIIHSKCLYDLEADESIMKAGTYGIGRMDLSQGQIVQYGGINFLPCDSVSTTGTTTYQNLIVLPNALQLWNGEDLWYGEQRLAHTSCWQLDWGFAYATHLSARKPTGCIKYLCASSLD